MLGETRQSIRCIHDIMYLTSEGRRSPTVLEFGFVLIAGLLAFGAAYFVFTAEVHKLRKLMYLLKSQQQPEQRSILIRWIFQGRGDKAERFARLFTIFPPFMWIVTALALLFTFVTGIAFLNVPESVGLLIGTLIISFPFYRSADSFDMLLVSRLARRLGPVRLGKEDETLLDEVQIALVKGTGYFWKLSTLSVAALSVAAVLMIVSESAYTFAPLAALTLVIALSTLTTRGLKNRLSTVEPVDTREVAPPMAGDHLSYGTVPLFNATRERLMRKFRYDPLLEQDLASDED